MTKKKTVSDPLAGYVTTNLQPNIYPFTRDLKEWSGDNREIITFNNFSNATPQLIYRVPLGKVLYITNASVGGHRSSVSGAGTILDYDLGGLSISATGSFGNKAFLLTFAHNPPIAGLTMTFNMPLKLTAGQGVWIANADPNYLFFGGFVGWIQDA
jgi:hypothetical protein